MFSLPFSFGPLPPLGSSRAVYALLIFGRWDRWALRRSCRKSSASRCGEHKPLDSRWPFALDIRPQLSLVPNWWEASRGQTESHTQDILDILSIPRICINKLCKYCGRILKERESNKSQYTEDNVSPLGRLDRRLPSRWKSSCEVRFLRRVLSL